jgi:hypothetical protein
MPVVTVAIGAVNGMVSATHNPTKPLLIKLPVPVETP